MSAKTNGKLRFAALRRVSTEQQEKMGESLRTQTADIEAAVKDLGGIVTEWYGGAEHATPGHEKKEVDRLLRDAERKRFRAVIVAHPDRWSRDNSASRRGLEVFKDHGIQFFAGSTEYDLFNPDHEMFLGISAVIGQFLAKNQNKKSMRNRIERAKRGLPSTAEKPYGRNWIWSKDRQTGRWEIDKTKQDIIQDCAKRYLADEGISKIAAEYGMNASNLHKILTKASGTAWQIKFTSKALNISEVVPMKVPRLLPEKTIQAVREKAAANRTYTHGPVKHKFLFSRMIFCAHCGYALTGQWNSKETRYYRHVSLDDGRQCCGPKQKPWIRADDLEDVVMRHLFVTFGNPAAVQKAIEDATPNDARVREAVKRLETINTELDKTKRGVQRILTLVSNDTITDEDAAEKLGKLKERQEMLEVEQARIESSLVDKPSKEQVKTVAKTIAGRFRVYTNARLAAKKRLANNDFDGMTYDEKKQLCQTVFSGKMADGRRMGVYVRWDEDGGWRYTIDGHLIHAEGPINPDWFVFGGPEHQDAVVTKSAEPRMDTNSHEYEEILPESDAVPRSPFSESNQMGFRSSLRRVPIRAY